MESDRFDALTARLLGTLSRRRSVGALAAISTSAALAPQATAGKRKKKKCPPPVTCPTTTPPAFCTGKNDCAQVTSEVCDAAGTGACKCYVRANPAGPFCGVFGSSVANCASCGAGTTCVVLGGACVGGFACVTPCPSPR